MLRRGRVRPLHTSKSHLIWRSDFALYVLIVGYRLRSFEPAPSPRWSFRDHFTYLINSLSMRLMAITMGDSADSNSIHSDQRSRCERRLKSARMRLARVKLLYMDRMTLGAFHHLSMSRCHLLWPLGSNIPHLPRLFPCFPMGRRPRSRTRFRSNVLLLVSAMV
jgi:hypothetical protein